MISVTHLSSYAYCPRKLYLQEILCLREPPKEALIRGSIRHQSYESINLAEEGLIKSIKKGTTREDLKNRYHQKHKKILLNVIQKNKEKLKRFNISPIDLFKEIWPLVSQESEIRAESIYNFIQKYGIFQEELWEKLTPKIKSELRIESETLGLKGIIDQIEIYDNNFIPIELKTGKSPKEGIWPSHKIQLIAYALLIEDKFKTEIKEGFVYYLDAKEKRRVLLNQFMRIEIKELIKKVNELLESDEIPHFEKNQNKCACCGLKEDCYDNEKLKVQLKQSFLSKS